jgi:hypothetical protein
MFYVLWEGPNFKTSGVLETTDQELYKDVVKKRRIDLFWVVLRERQSKTTVYFKIGVATPSFIAFVTSFAVEHSFKDDACAVAPSFLRL